MTARELVEAAIARHERFGERLHAYSFWAPEQARAVADAADAAFSAGVSAGPLQGLPVSIKDLFAAAGYPCFAGSSRRLPADPWERAGMPVGLQLIAPALPRRSCSRLRSRPRECSEPRQTGLARRLCSFRDATNRLTGSSARGSQIAISQASSGIIIMGKR